MSTTSSSPRKRRTTGWSSAGGSRVRSLAGGLRAGACSAARARRSSPTSTATTASRSGTRPAGAPTRPSRTASGTATSWLRPSGAQSRSPVSVTLLAGPATGTLDEYAQRYLADRTIATSRAEERQGVPGKSWVYATADGAHALSPAAAAPRGQGDRPLRAGRRRGFRAPGRGDRGDLVEPHARAAGALPAGSDFKQQQASLGIPGELARDAHASRAAARWSCST